MFLPSAAKRRVRPSPSISSIFPGLYTFSSSLPLFHVRGRSTADVSIGPPRSTSSSLSFNVRVEQDAGPVRVSPDDVIGRDV
ncbi:hypothetical protein ANN_09061 [Periplaneta americana]|uniref:Uncharacterized protein n=1 Tax=Periplaneta americana TaxID=6978 RepID=A0ABQ8TKR2_PERAM|nr:hypothetical protein ANN_09061 [Periplaneta americana]